jgi:Family of unknown function (DUF6519)/Right handed beta helix region
MSVDCSRFTFDPWKDYLGVLMQQGRVQLDADWNEWLSAFLRRVQAGTLDTFGPAEAGHAIVPSTTPKGFQILVESGVLTIGPGRLYVDGILVENHGGPEIGWDARLAELRGASAVPLFEQPYLPFNEADQPAPADVFDRPDLAGGPHLVYVDVWQREVTHLQDRDLVEKAVGVDTTARVQTVWQVGLLPDVGNVTCGTDDEDVPGWSDLIRPSGGRLTTSTGDLPGDPNPCLVPPSAGYKGLENQLYRVEIHRGGPQGEATFKWSRDNATVATLVSEIQGGTRLVVESLGRDEVLGFHAGEWVEVLDDWHEMHGLPGILRRIRTGDGVDAATRSILFDDALPAGLFPVDGQGRTDVSRHTRVRRWDQSKNIRRADGSVFHDLDASASSDGIPVPPAGTALALESGILVELGLPDGGEFRMGDYWVFTARAADGSIELLDEAPPRGVHHHYARLALVTFPDTEVDCRVPWPPAVGDESCDCTVCVSPESHQAGTPSIQAAIESVKQSGGTVCLEPGVYLLREPLRIEEARSVRVRGQGWATHLVQAAGGEAVRVTDSANVVVENLRITTSVRDGASAITLKNDFDVALARLLILGLGVGDRPGAGVAVEGQAVAVRVAECFVGAGIGIRGPTGDDDYLVTSGLRIENNTLLASKRGISFDRRAIHLGATRISNNRVVGCQEVGIRAIGGVPVDASFDVEGNLIEVDGSGIVVGTDALRIAENDVRALPGERPGDGIALVAGLDPTGIDHLQVLANRVTGLRGHGIAIRTRINSGMIKMNVLAQLTGGGIVMEGDGEADTLVVENNQVLEAGGADSKDLQPAGMRFVRVADLDVRANAVTGFARESRQGKSRTAILAVGSARTRVTGNQVTGIAPADGFAGQSAGIGLIGPLQEAVVAENSVRRRAKPEDKLGPAEWIGVSVRAAVELGRVVERSVFTPLGDLALARVAESVFLFTGPRLWLLAGAPGEVAVRGNEIESELSTGFPVMISAAACCRLADNRIALLPFDGEDPRLSNPTVVRARRAIVSSNDLRGPGRGKAEVLRVQIGADGGAAIVGNLRSGEITVNGAPLSAPWTPLNPLTGE